MAIGTRALEDAEYESINALIVDGASVTVHVAVVQAQNTEACTIVVSSNWVSIKEPTDIVWELVASSKNAGWRITDIDFHGALDFTNSGPSNSGEGWQCRDEYTSKGVVFKYDIECTQGDKVCRLDPVVENKPPQ